MTDTHIAFETDAYVDWKVNQNFTVSVVTAFADPGKAVQQATGRTKNFAYGMVYVATAIRQPAEERSHECKIQNAVV